MLFWLQLTAAVFTGITGAVTFTWYAKSKNQGHLFTACALFLAAGIFGYLTFSNGP